MFTVQFPFSALTTDQISTIKGILYPEIVIRAEPASIDSIAGDFSPLPSDIILKTLDARQENLAKNIGKGHRIFFGVAGSGKTLLLISYAKLLINQNKDNKILVLCFNVSLASSLRSVIHSDPNNPKYKEITITNFHQWASSIVGKIDPQSGINYDESVGHQLLARLSNYSEEEKWDAILIDEAHTFVKIWFECCVKALKDSENGDLMIVADASQSLYKRPNFTWKEVGIKAQGHTISKKFDLDKNYRNTQEILSAAWGLLSQARQKHELLEDDEVTFPVVQPNAALRHGCRPKICVVSNPENQEQAVIKTIQELLKTDLKSNEIAILYRHKKEKLLNLIKQLDELKITNYWVTRNDNTKANYSQNKEGVRIITCLSSLGLEFKAVLILWLEQFDECTNNKEGALLATRELYVGMTRSQEYLYFFASEQAKLLARLKESNQFDVSTSL